MRDSAARAYPENMDAGFAVFRGALDAPSVDALRAAAHALPLGRRLLSIPAVTACIRSVEIRSVVEAVLGRDAFAVRGLYLDKSPEQNWAVPWHQDLAIAVKARIEAGGFRGWSIKEGVPHVHPPAQILERMAAIRIHLDDSDARNGGLKLVPGSHLRGRLQAEEADRLVAAGPCEAPSLAAGDVLMMRPLLLHASPKAREPRRRRVIHVEFAAIDLPGGLEWFERV